MANERSECRVHLESTDVLCSLEVAPEGYADPVLKDAFSAIFLACPILFVGYGLADDDFDQILGRVRALLHPPCRRGGARSRSACNARYARRALGTMALGQEHVALLSARSTPARGSRRWKAELDLGGQPRRLAAETSHGGWLAAPTERKGAYLLRGTALEEAIRRSGTRPPWSRSTPAAFSANFPP